MRTFRHSANDKIWFTSDLHFGHDKEFLWGPREFSSVDEMNETLIENINKKVKEDDYLYILGDFALCPIDEARYWISKINCQNITLIVGNHDTDARLQLYEDNGFTVQFAGRLRYGKYHFFLSHYQTLTENSGEDYLTNAYINLYGHTHQNWIWTPEYPFSYCVCPEANNCFPHEINEIIAHLKEMLQLERLKKSIDI